MNAAEYRQLNTEHIVWCSFSNSYRMCRVLAIEQPHHIVVEALGKDGPSGKPLTRRARYRSVDIRKAGQTQAELKAYREEVLARRKQGCLDSR